MANVQEVEPLFSKSKKISGIGRKAFLPFICTNNRYVVLFYQTGFTQIYYIVGKFPEDGDEEEGGEEASPLLSHGISWGPEQLYGDGCNAQAAINKSGAVVLVRSRTFARKCVFSMGKINENRTIEWIQKDEYLCSGVNPTVEMNGNTVLFLHEADYGPYRSYYNIGEVRQSNKLYLTGQRDVRLEALDDCKELSVAITDDCNVVISCRNKFGSSLYYAVGKLNDVALEDVVLKGQYASGYYSRISVLSSGIVFEVHEASVGFGLRYKCGSLQHSDNTIEWCEGTHYGSGYYPAIAVSDNYNVVEVHILNQSIIRASGELQYIVGKLSQGKP